MGITGPLWLWFRDYLQNRYHYVNIDGQNSDLLPVHSGVPQGSVLGPLLFLIYVNDIPSLCTISSVFMFADDTKLIASSSHASHHDTLQKDLNSLHSWCQSWKLELNSSKCTHMHISLSSSTSQHTYKIGEDIINTVSQQKDLGVIVTDSLLWSAHIHSICGKAYKSLYLVGAQFHLVL